MPVIALPSTNLLSENSSKSVKFKVLKAPMGDGKGQRAPDGIDNKIDVWTLVWQDLTTAEAKVITDVLDSTKGAYHMLWTPFGETAQKKFTMTEDGYSTSFSSGYATVRATVEQYYGP